MNNEREKGARMIPSDASFRARQSAIWQKNKVLSELQIHEKCFLLIFLWVCEVLLLEAFAVTQCEPCCLAGSHTNLDEYKQQREKLQCLYL